MFNYRNSLYAPTNIFVYQQDEKYFHIWQRSEAQKLVKPQQKLLHLPQVDTHSHENSFNVKFCLEMLKLHFAHFPLSCNICIFILSHNNCGKIYSTIKFCWLGQYFAIPASLLFSKAFVAKTEVFMYLICMLL